MIRVLLINMPFAAADLPSLALGLFKSRLNAEAIPCDVQHLNLTFAEMIGWENYSFMLQSPSVLAGERLFADSLFGDRVPSDAEYYQDLMTEEGVPQEAIRRLQQIKGHVPSFLQHCLDQVPWHAYDVIGFTSLFEQNLASLALANLVKQRHPDKVIVFGGANCEDIMGVTLHRCFPFVDYVCTGEADNSFPELVKRLAYGHPPNDLPGLVYRAHGKTVACGPAALIRDMDALPVPDYDEYFEHLNQSSIATHVRPCLLMESARGCWWGEKAHCTFCGLNGLTMKFRGKSAERCVGEMQHLMHRYNIRFVRMVDNILEPDYFNNMLPEIMRSDLRPEIIFEVKANLSKQQISILADAQVTIQAGIENLSSHTLKLMRKGSNTLMNIQTLKWCKQYGVFADWNMLYGFPGETAEDYARNLELAQMLTHLDPPAGCGPIRLDRFSPNFDDADALGFTRLRPMKVFKYIYPFDERTLSDLVYYFDFDYKEEIDDGGHAEALQQAIGSWKNSQDQLQSAREGGTGRRRGSSLRVL